jgi:hypothetical protein
VKPDEMRPSSAESPPGVLAAPNSRPSSASAEPLQTAVQDTSEFENDSIADSSASFQGSEVILESTANRTSSDFPAEHLALSVSNLLEPGQQCAIEEDSTDKGVGEVMQAGSSADIDAETSNTLLPNSEQIQNIRQVPDSEASTMLQSAAAIDDQSAVIESGTVGIVEAEHASDSQALNDAGMTGTKDM